MNKKMFKNVKFEKMISIILLFLIMFMQIIKFPTSVEAADTYEGLKMEVTKLTSMNVGDTVEITISTDGEPIGSVDAYITYDFSIFEQVTEEDIECLQDYWNVDNLDYNEDYYGENTGYLILANSKGRANTGDIAKITLTVKNATNVAEFIMTDTYVVLEDTSSVGPLEEMVCQMKVSNKYDITYDPNTTDTVTGMPENDKKTENIDYTIGAAPKRTGYSFIEWNTKQDGSGTKYAAGATYTENANLTLYAQWKKQTTLTVNPNGGTWEGSSTTKKFTQDEGTTKIINNPTKTPNGNVVSFDPNGGQYTGMPITQTTSFNGWTGATLSGTRYTFGTSDETITANYVGNEITMPTATKTGSKFLGWADSEGNLVAEAGKNYTPAYTTPNAEIKLTAQWEAEEYVLTINPNGGTYNGNVNNSTVKGKYKSTVTVSDPVKTGYTVTLDNNDGTGATSPKVQTYTFNGWTVVSGKGTINNKTYTFDAENGEIKANYTAGKVEFTTPTRTGYTFNGWYTSKTGGTKVETPYEPKSNITLYAQWTANTYTMTFDAGEDATVDENSREVTYGSKYGTLPIPTKTGYSFEGWNKEDGTTATENDVVTGDITLTAQWKAEEYVLTINPNGGTYNGSQNNSTEKGTYKSTVTVADPVKTGYTVTLDNNDGTGTTSQKVQTYTFNGWTVVSGKGTINNKTYTFDAENGEIKANYTAGKVELTTPIRTGYTFNGWYTSKTGGTKVQTPYEPKSNITLYAQWTANTYTMTFDAGEDATIDENSREVTYGSKYGTLPIPTKTGYSFEGWNKEDGTTATENDVVTGDITLTAQWKAEEYVLTINPNGGTYNGSQNNSTEKGTYKSTVTVANPTRTGYTVTLDNNDETGTTSEKVQTYTFEGWTVVSGAGTINNTTYTFEAENGEIKADYIANKVELPTITRIGYTFNGWYTARTGGTEVATSYEPTSNVTLYAQWTKNIFTITFEAGEDATIDITSKEVEYGSEYGTLPTPTKEGYIFKGWNKEDGTKATDKDIATEDITLTAEWEEILYLTSTEYLIGTGVNPKNEWAPGQESKYEEGDVYIKGIRPQAGLRVYSTQVPPNTGTYLEELLSNLNTNADEIKVYIPEKDANGEIVLKEENIVGENTLIATAMIIKLTKGEQEIQLTLIVRGDLLVVNKLIGDGKITNTEAARLKTLSNYTLTTNYTIEEQQAIDYYINTENRWSTNKQAIIRAYQDHTLRDIR